MGVALYRPWSLLTNRGMRNSRQVAFVAGFPAGFSPLAKQGMILKDIHKPVPMYKEKLEASMDRYFSKVKVGDYVKRFK